LHSTESQYATKSIQVIERLLKLDKLMFHLSQTQEAGL